MELANCKRCGIVYRKQYGTRYCPSCLRAEDEEFQRVRNYITEHPEAPVIQVSQATKVSTARIYEYVRLGKLVARSPESDLAVECTSCGDRIVSGRFCYSCRQKFAQAKERDAGAAGEIHMRGRLHLRNRVLDKDEKR